MSKLNIKKVKFGTLYDGSEVNLYTVSNGKMSFSATDYGCIITSIIIPGKNNKPTDVVLGFSTLEGYAKDDLSMGAAVGRFANRIGNGCFELDGVKYELDKNDGINTLHGGYDRWEKKLWLAREVEGPEGLGVEFTRTSPDGEQGFPGNLQMSVTYFLNEKNELLIKYNAVTDKATPINVINHSYFNLAGYQSGPVYSQELKLNCSRYVESSEKLIPTGRLLEAKGTAYDFSEEKPLGKDIGQLLNGYDHCYCVDAYDGSQELKRCATLREPVSGVKMHVDTTMPGVHVYTANFIEGSCGKLGFLHHNHGAVCFETEAYPDSPNQKNFPDCILKPGETWQQYTRYGFEF